MIRDRFPPQAVSTTMRQLRIWFYDEKNKQIVQNGIHIGDYLEQKRHFYEATSSGYTLRESKKETITLKAGDTFHFFTKKYEHGDTEGKFERVTLFSGVQNVWRRGPRTRPSRLSVAGSYNIVVIYDVMEAREGFWSKYSVCIYLNYIIQINLKPMENCQHEQKHFRRNGTT